METLGDDTIDRENVQPVEAPLSEEDGEEAVQSDGGTGTWGHTLGYGVDPAVLPGGGADGVPASGGFGIPVGLQGGAIIFFTVAVGDFNAVYVEFPAVGPGVPARGRARVGMSAGHWVTIRGLSAGSLGSTRVRKSR